MGAIWSKSCGADGIALASKDIKVKLGASGYANIAMATPKVSGTSLYLKQEEPVEGDKEQE